MANNNMSPSLSESEEVSEDDSADGAQVLS